MTTDSLAARTEAARAAWGVRLQMFLGGALFATWGVHVPSIKRHFGLGEQSLGFAMLAAGVGSLLALMVAGGVVGRFGSRRVARVSGVVYACCIGALLASQSYLLLLAAMLALGMSVSLFDVAVNAEASAIETEAGRPLMSGFHALFSLGGMAGAALASPLLAVGLSPLWHLVGAAVVGVFGAWGASLLMLRRPAARAAGTGGLSWPRGPLRWIGLLAALGLATEGAMYDWSVLYMAQELGAVPGCAALGYASFSAAMAAGRFAGDAVRARMAAVPLLQASGALAGAGLLLVLGGGVPWLGLLGFALVGLGLANVVPLLFSASARVPGVAPAHGIAAVSALGYLGMMAGPPLIGLIAEARSLTHGLAAVLVCAAVLSLAARRALPAA